MLKKRIALLLLALALLTTSITVTMAEEPTSQLAAEEASGIDEQLETLIESSNTSEASEYIKYFKKAILPVRAARNACVGTSNFLYMVGGRDRLYNLLGKDDDYSFLANKTQPLSFNEDEMRVLTKYMTAYSKDYNKTKRLDGLKSILQLSSVVTASRILFSALEKPSVPSEFEYIDSLLELSLQASEKYKDEIHAALLDPEKDANEIKFDDSFLEELQIVFELL